ncbi:MAG: PqqD family protein [Clostridia bacterium]|nr:PqqD family protein [Clostridia bacterium]
MKIKEGFMLREVAGFFLVVPLGAKASFQGMMKLNATGKLLWERLTAGADEAALIAALLEAYEVDEATAKADVADFIAHLERIEVLED